LTLSLVTETDISNLTGTKLDSGVITAIGEQAEREVTSYCKRKGITSLSGDQVKTAVLKLAYAGILARYQAEGMITRTDGSTGTGHVDWKEALGSLTSFIRQAREEAFQILDEYICLPVSSLDTDGLTRDDATISQAKLDQSSIAGVDEWDDEFTRVL
jgi:hypothetical protein